MKTRLFTAVSIAFLQAGAIAAKTPGNTTPAAATTITVQAKDKINSLQRAVKSAIANHPALSAAHKAQQAADSAIGEAQAELYPTIDLRAAAGRAQSENSTTVGAGDQHRTMNPFESSLLIRQSLYSGGRISNNIAKRKNSASEAFYSFLNEKEKTVFDAIDVYVEYNRSTSLVQLAKNNVKVHQDILATVSERKKRGMARDADVIQVKGRLSLATAQYHRELANQASNSEQFVEVIGFKPAAQLGAANDMSTLLPKDLRAAKNEALLVHPLVKARKSNLEAAESAVKEANGAFSPQVALELRAQENDNVSGSYSNDDSYSAMLVVNWNIFRGGGDKATKKSRIFEAAQAEDLLLDEKRKIVRNTALAWNDYSAILVELNYFLQHEKAMKETLNAYQEQYKLNQRTLFDVLNAQNELFQASSRVIDTKSAKTRGVYAIFGNMGNVSGKFE
ncbi:MAG: TolC family outer membrane protein [Lentisphaeraceae bacterium]|nr:TolC family outer membrane protein [Lentisphaeraceae bacterium]